MEDAIIKSKEIKYKCISIKDLIRTFVIWSKFSSLHILCQRVTAGLNWKNLTLLHFKKLYNNELQDITLVFNYVLVIFTCVLFVLNCVLLAITCAFTQINLCSTCVFHIQLTPMACNGVLTPPPSKNNALQIGNRPVLKFFDPPPSPQTFYSPLQLETKNMKMWS